MNTANLQLRGLVMALAALIAQMQRNGLLSSAEIEEALVTAEKRVADDFETETLSDANRDAVLFPIRALRWACDSGNSLTFEAIAGTIGETKPDS